MGPSKITLKSTPKVVNVAAPHHRTCISSVYGWSWAVEPIWGSPDGEICQKLENTRAIVALSDPHVTLESTPKVVNVAATHHRTCIPRVYGWSWAFESILGSPDREIC